MLEGYEEEIQRRRDLMTKSMQSCVHDPHNTISNKIFLQDFPIILNSELLEFIEEMFPKYYMNSVVSAG